MQNINRQTIANDLSIQLPTPTKEAPYVQIQQIFDIYANTKHNLSSRKFIVNCAFFYINKFLPKTHNFDKGLEKDQRFYLKEQWDRLALLKVQEYFKLHNLPNSVNRYSSFQVVNLMSGIRKTLRFAAEHGLTKDKFFLPAVAPSAVKETTKNIAYSSDELQAIKTVLNTEVQYTEKIISRKGYTKTGIGRDPRLKKRGSKLADDYKNYGWGNPENVRWYFENVMNCQVLLGTREDRQKHKRFFSSVYKIFKGGLPEMYKSWGVAPIITSSLLIPLVAKLALETGLNPASLLNLQVDAFQINPLTNTPTLKYYKERSKGDMEINLTTDSTHEELRIFNDRRIKTIEKIIQQILMLTDEIRKNADKDMQKYLMLYQRSESFSYGRISILNRCVTNLWCKKMCKKYSLKSRTGESLNFNFVRFRSSLFTNLVVKGADVRELKNNSGHESLRTTFRYLAKEVLEIKIRKDISEIISHIYSNSKKVKQAKIPYTISNADDQKSLKVYKGITADCINVYNPPTGIKKKTKHIEGEACAHYNMCLTCKNALIPRNRLPYLFFYYTQVRIAYTKHTINLPTPDIYQTVLAVLETIFDPKLSQFSEEDILWAKKEAQFIDTIIDPVVYQKIDRGSK